MRFAESRHVESALGGMYRGHSFSGVTGTIAAALAAGATVCAARYGEDEEGKCLLKWLHLHYVCLGNFTVPITAGRQLQLVRGSGGDPSAGTALDIVRDDSAEENEPLLTGMIASTGGLTMTDVEYEETVRARLLLANVGASGLEREEIWTFDDPFILRPGELFGILTPAQFDAGGTWQLGVKGGAIGGLR